MYEENFGELRRNNLVAMIYQLHHETLWSFTVHKCGYYGRCTDQANDILQKVYEKILLKPGLVQRGLQEKGVAYLLTMVIYELKSLNRKEKKAKEREQLFVQFQTTSVTQRENVEDHFTRFLQELKPLLSEGDRTILKYYREGYSYREISRKVQLLPNTVGARICRAKKKIRNL